MNGCVPVRSSVDHHPREGLLIFLLASCLGTAGDFQIWPRHSGVQKLQPGARLCPPRTSQICLQVKQKTISNLRIAFCADFCSSFNIVMQPVSDENCLYANLSSCTAIFPMADCGTVRHKLKLPPPSVYCSLYFSKF